MAGTASLVRFVAKPSFLTAQRFILRASSCHQSIHTCKVCLASEAEFEAAKTRLNALKEDPGNEHKLKIYALFKQATSGQCNKPKPSAFDFVAKAKWTAWNELGSMTQEVARAEYISIVDTLVQNEGGSPAGTEEPSSTSQEQSAFSDIIYEVTGKVARISLNRPNKKNSITLQTYSEIGAAFKMAAEDDAVTVALLTGVGEYYSSGNDLNNFSAVPPNEIATFAVEAGDILENFVNSFIDFPKPLIAAVNGPCIGVACTTLGLCDVVYAADTATFVTPFPALGQSPEGCSSYIFPKIMGTSHANEVLLFGRKLTAQEGKERGLVADVFPKASFMEEINRRVEEYSNLPPKASVAAKNIIKQNERDLLQKVNRAECDLLVKLWQSPECFQAVMDFFSRKK